MPPLTACPPACLPACSPPPSSLSAWGVVCLCKDIFTSPTPLIWSPLCPLCGLSLDQPPACPQISQNPASKWTVLCLPFPGTQHRCVWLPRGPPRVLVCGCDWRSDRVLHSVLPPTWGFSSWDTLRADERGLHCRPRAHAGQAGLHAGCTSTGGRHRSPKRMKGSGSSVCAFTAS